MRRVIFVIIFVLLGVVCLSSTIRLSDELYEFFYEDNSSDTSSNSSNNSSGPNDTQSPGDNTGTLVSATTFKRTEERFGLNYSIDTSFYVKQNEYYYYKLDSDENKFVKSDVILEGKTLYTDCGDFVYVRVEESIPQDDLKSVFISRSFFDSPGEQVESLPYNVCLISQTQTEKREIFYYKEFNNFCYFSYEIPFFMVIAKIEKTELVNGACWYVDEESKLFGFTTYDYNLASPSDCSDFYWYYYDYD